MVALCARTASIFGCSWWSFVARYSDMKCYLGPVLF